MNKYIKAALPFGLVKHIQKRDYMKSLMPSKEISDVIRENEKFKDIHKGQRCFIVGTGPSINTQDLLPLKNEIVFSLSALYHHPDYEAIHPRYQVFSGMILHPHYKENASVPAEIYSEASSKVKSDILFTNYKDIHLIRDNHFFTHCNVFYVTANAPITNLKTEGIDLTRNIYGYYVIPELAIQIAIYMGFKEIYLLGLDHTWLREVLNDKNYEHHFYKYWRLK
jgi:hypothetical protein